MTDETPAYRAQTGPDHYLDAEQWLRYAEDAYHSNEDMAVAAAAAAIAHGHAVLAQAAVLGMFFAGILVDDLDPWNGDDVAQRRALEAKIEAARSARDAGAFGWFDAGVVR